MDDKTNLAGGFYRARLRIIDWLLTLAWHLAPKDEEGTAIQKATERWTPPWRCHYLSKSGIPVPLRHDCKHTVIIQPRSALGRALLLKRPAQVRFRGKETEMAKDVRTCDYCGDPIPVADWPKHREDCRRDTNATAGRKRPKEAPRKHPRETK